MRENSLTDEDYERFTDILAGAIEQPSVLTPWETAFIADFSEKHDDWERRISVSPKQWAILERIEGKL